MDIECIEELKTIEKDMQSLLEQVKEEVRLGDVKTETFQRYIKLVSLLTDNIEKIFNTWHEHEKWKNKQCILHLRNCIKELEE